MKGLVAKGAVRVDEFWKNMQPTLVVLSPKVRSVIRVKPPRRSGGGAAVKSRHGKAVLFEVGPTGVVKLIAKKHHYLLFFHRKNRG